MKRLVVFFLILALLLVLAGREALAGNIVLSGAPGKGPWNAALTKDRTLELFADHINNAFNLPRDVPLSVEDCDEANAYYSDEDKKIILCRELFKELYEQARELAGKDVEARETLFLDSIIFTLYHELGHALIDLFDLPVTGKEEDVADQVSTWIILNEIWDNRQDGVDGALDAADFFSLTGDREVEELDDVKDMAFWDSHSLDQQRYFNIVCWTYGFDPKLTEESLGEKITEVLDPERADGCEQEYAVMNKSLTRLLSPYFKKTSKPAK